MTTLVLLSVAAVIGFILRFRPFISLLLGVLLVGAGAILIEMAARLLGWAGLRWYAPLLALVLMELTYAVSALLEEVWPKSLPGRGLRRWARSSGRQAPR